MNVPAKASSQSVAVQWVQQIERQIKAALPKAIDAGRFVRIVSTAIRLNPDLAACTRHSLLGCVLQAAQWGLAVNDGLGSAYLIPRNTKVRGRNGEPDAWVKTCTLQVGYKGLRKLAKRSAAVSDIFSGTVYERDVFSYRACPLSLLHEPYIGPDRGAVRCYYAAGYRDDRLVAVQLILPSDAEDARRRSDAGSAGKGPWTSDYDAMARKTAIRRLCTQQLDLEADDMLARAARVDEAADLEQPQEFDIGVLDAVDDAAGDLVLEASNSPALPAPAKRMDLPTGRLVTSPQPVAASATA